ncbi:MAG: leucine efflux protein LeuE [Micromonosporaceae bacterium]
MFGVTDIWTYVLGTIAIVLLPGPNTLFVLSTAARSGVRAGYRAALGVFLGDWLLMMAAAAGVGSLLRAYPPLFLVIKYGGALYLSYVGITMAIGAWRQRRRDAAAPGEVESAGAEPAGSAANAGETSGARRPFRRALLISLLNPKAILFMISFFIQFIDPAYPRPALTFLALALILQACSAVYLSCLIFSGRYLAEMARRRRGVTRAFTTGVAALFVGFGVRLATASLG